MRFSTWLLFPLLCAVPTAGQELLGPDRIPWPPDAVGASKQAPTRVRWLFSPHDRDGARALLASDAQLDLVAKLQRFEDLWILEADAADAAEVASRWNSLGTLRADRSGVAQLFETTSLVGAFQTWTELDVWGDRYGTIAIMDSGADTAHDDLGDRDEDDEDAPPQSAGDADDWVDAGQFGHSKDERVRVVGWHDVSDDMPGNVGPYDYERHGTALAGVAFGSGRVDVRYRGVAPQGRFVVVKTYNFEGQWQLWASDLLLGIDWVLAHRDSHRIRAVLIGASWDEDLGIAAGVEALMDAGIAVIAPAGNDASLPMGYPALVEDVITVGATDELARLAAYSRVDPGAARRLDLLAPGGTLFTPNSSVIACDNEPNDSYRGRVGTSIAAAHVAGATSLLCHVLEESGRPWRYDRAQVRWFGALLRATCVETEGAEAAAPIAPTLQRAGWDRAEGAGFLQVRALVDAVRRSHWPGELEQLELQSPRVGDAVWAARMPVWGVAGLRVELLPPVDADFDLLLYEESDDDLLLRGASLDPRPGRAERIEIAQPRTGNYVLVVRRVSGGGSATLQSERILNDETGWPLQLSSPITQPPALADLDGDGRIEILAVNNLPIDASAHTWFVFSADGRSFGLFPRTYFSAGDRLGEVGSPAVASLSGASVLVSGSAFGVVYGIRVSDAQQLFATTVSGNAPTTGAVVLGGAGTARLAVGTENGMVLLDAAGGIASTWNLSAPVLQDPLLIDLDGDGNEELVFAEGQLRVHARRGDGSALAGWPVELSGASLLGAPIGFGDGAGLRRVAWVEALASGNSRLQVRAASGQSVAGFPLDFTTDAGAVAAALGGVIASRLSEYGPTQLGAAALHRASDGSVGLAVHRFDTAGLQQRGSLLRITAPAFAATSLVLARAALSDLRAARITSRPQADWLFAVQASWEEFDVTQRRRYGSRQGQQLLSGSGEPLRFAATRDGHELAPPLGALAPSIADLDADRVADLVIARGSRIHRQVASVPSDPSYFWSLPRVDIRRSGCYRCGLDPVVAAGQAWTAELAVSPNPFNPRTLIQWQWPRAGRVEFELFDARGRCVRAWSRLLTVPGRQSETLDAIDDWGAPLASGVYRLRLRDEGGEITRSLTLVR